jgi:hypothetical protein
MEIAVVPIGEDVEMNLSNIYIRDNILLKIAV